MCLDAESGKLTEKMAILPHSGRESVSCAANKGIRRRWLSHRANVCSQLSRITKTVCVRRWKTIAEIMSKISDDLWALKHVTGEDKLELLNAWYLTMMPDAVRRGRSAALARAAQVAVNWITFPAPSNSFMARKTSFPHYAMQPCTTSTDPGNDVD